MMAVVNLQVLYGYEQEMIRSRQLCLRLLEKRLENGSPTSYYFVTRNFG
jgi:hypothetical protein